MSEDTKQKVGRAFAALVHGDVDKARRFNAAVRDACGGYVPDIVARSLILLHDLLDADETAS